MIELNVVTIKSGGKLEPESIQVRHGDIVAFQADGTDVVLCFDRAAFFGAYRYEIPDGTTLPLVVQAQAPDGDTAYSIKTDLEDECFPRSDREGTIRISGATDEDTDEDGKDDDDDRTGGGKAKVGGGS